MHGHMAKSPSRCVACASEHSAPRFQWQDFAFKYGSSVEQRSHINGRGSDCMMEYQCVAVRWLAGRREGVNTLAQKEWRETHRMPHIRARQMDRLCVNPPTCITAAIKLRIKGTGALPQPRHVRNGVNTCLAAPHYIRKYEHRHANDPDCRSSRRCVVWWYRAIRWTP